jgi:hypothetical protein
MIDTTIPVESLWADSITKTTQHVEGWQYDFDEDGTMQWWQAVLCYGDVDEHDAECAKCEGIGNIDPDGTEEPEECPVCQGEGSVHVEGGNDGHLSDATGTCQNEHCEHYGDHVDSAEGPMMNYWYPIEGRAFDAEDAALKLLDVPLCVVQVNGTYGLALTGGGMDLTWEIVEAFVTLGFLPPRDHVDLPLMAQPYDDTALYLIEACRRTVSIMANWLVNDLERLDRVEAWVNERRTN